MKLTINTWYTFENETEISYEHKARTSVEISEKNTIKSVIDIHTEKVGAIERKILK